MMQVEVKPKCIMHIPWQLLTESVSATEIRPYRMLDAFMEFGYEVFFIMGNVKQRKDQIKKLQKRLANGERFDFLYSESSTLPMMLTEPHHFPTHPFIDVKLFQICKKQRIPIGLFYRDIYWAFSRVKRFNLLKHYFSLIFHLIDIYIYNNYLSALYFPSDSKSILYQLIPNLSQNISIYDLMPGTQLIDDQSGFKEDYFLYIGSVSSDLYNISMIIKCFQKFPQYRLIICTPQKQWEAFRVQFVPSLPDNVTVTHKVNDEAQALLQKAKYALCYFPDCEYRKLALPFKLFEYLSYGIPVICNASDYTGKIINEHCLGYSIGYSEKALSELLISLEMRNDYDLLVDKIKVFNKQNTWLKRVEKVVNTLRGQSVSH